MQNESGNARQCTAALQDDVASKALTDWHFSALADQHPFGLALDCHHASCPGDTHSREKALVVRVADCPHGGHADDCPRGEGCVEEVGDCHRAEAPDEGVDGCRHEGVAAGAAHRGCHHGDDDCGCGSGNVGRSDFCRDLRPSLALVKFSKGLLQAQ